MILDGSTYVTTSCFESLTPVKRHGTTVFFALCCNHWNLIICQEVGNLNAHNKQNGRLYFTKRKGKAKEKGGKKGTTNCGLRKVEKHEAFRGIVSL